MIKIRYIQCVTVRSKGCPGPCIEKDPLLSVQIQIAGLEVQADAHVLRFSLCAVEQLLKRRLLLDAERAFFEDLIGHAVSIESRLRDVAAVGTVSLSLERRDLIF